MDKREKIIMNSAFAFLFFLCFIPPLAYIVFFVLLPLCIIKYRSQLFQDNKYILILFGAVFLSSLFSVSKLLSLATMFIFCCYILSYFIFLHLKIPGKKLWTVILISGLVITIIGIILYLTKTNFAFKNKFISFRFLPVSSTLGNANRFAQYLILTIPFALSFILFSGKLRDKILPGILLLLVLFSVYITKSLMGIIVVFILIVGILCFKNKWIGLIIFIVGIGIGMHKKEELLGFTNANCSEKRLYTYTQIVPAVLKHNPITGCGIGAYKKGTLKYIPESDRNKGLCSHAHNIYLNYLAETGILGLTVFLLFIGMFFYRNLRYLKKNFDWFVLGGCFSILGILLDGTAETCIDYLPLGLLFFCIMGFVDSVSHTTT